GERLLIQWLFRKAANWKGKALGMYASYLRGNDYPLSFKTGRALQDRTLETINRIASIDTGREYIEEVERKILSEGFQFQLRIGIQSKSEENLVGQIEN